MGLNKPVNRTYLKIAFGRLRQKAEETTPGAESRKKEDGSVVWENVYADLTGILENVRFQTHEEYGNSWIVEVADGNEKYAIQVSEDSAYGRDLLKKLPNLYRGSIYTFKPFDFERDKRKYAGISIILMPDEIKIGSFYHQYEGQGEDTKVTLLNGYPAYEGPKNDKDEWKIYCLKVAKFLRGKAMEHLKGNFNTPTDTKTVEPEEPEPSHEEGKVDDLPFVWALPFILPLMGLAGEVTKIL